MHLFSLSTLQKQELSFIAPLSKLDSFDPSNNSVSDIMHDVLEGVRFMEIVDIFTALIDDGILTEAEIDARLLNLLFDSNNRPSLLKGN